MKNQFAYRVLQASVCLSIMLLPYIAKSQSSDFFSKTQFTIITNFFSQETGPTAYEMNEDFQKLFYNNPFFGIEMEYEILPQVSAGLGLNFSHSQVNRNESIVFVMAPPPGTISNFYTTYHFNSLLIEPKVTATTNFYGLGLYWSAGPIFSFAVLNSNKDGALYYEPDKVVKKYHSRSKSFNAGIQGATGLKYFFTENLGLNFEIGYKYFSDSKITHLQNYFMERSTSYPYQINSFYQSVGVIFRL